MSTALFEENRLSPPQQSPANLKKPESSPVPTFVVEQFGQSKPIRRSSSWSAKGDWEKKFFERVVIWMSIIAITPLILIHVITFFHPEIFLFPVKP